jgi:hypothetical protein
MGTPTIETGANNVSVEVVRPEVSIDLGTRTVTVEGGPNNVTIEAIRRVVSFDVGPQAVTVDGGKFAGIGEAPDNLVGYMRKNKSWLPVEIPSIIVSKIAAEVIGGHRVVIVNSDNKLLYANNSIPEHKWKILGISTQAAVLGAACIYAINNQEIQEVSWAWDTAKPIYLTGLGLLTQVPPTTGFINVVAFPTSPTSLTVRLSNPITLGV